MKNIIVHRILIPVDFSPAGNCALEHGTYLANKYRADVFLLHILESKDSYPHEWFENQDHSPGTELIKTKVTEKLNEYAENITKKYGVYVEKIITKGKPVFNIVESAKEHDINLIVMGTHLVKGVTAVFKGNTAQKVVNLSPCPVITIREGAKEDGFKLIVLPVNESRYSRQKVSNVLPLAAKCNSEVHILGVIQSDDKSDIAKLNIKINTVQEAVENAGLRFTRKIVTGLNVAEETIKYAEGVHADLLSIMTDNESNMPGMFMSAFERKIVNHSKVPVLSVKPITGPYESAS